MNIPAPFTAVDVDFNNSTEMALLLNSAAGFARMSYGPNFPGVNAPSGLKNDATVYTATVTIDGAPNLVTVTGSAAQSITTLLAQINLDLLGAVATLLGGDIMITSASTGPLSAVTAVDTGANPLFASVKGKNFGFVTKAEFKGGDNYVVWPKLDAVTQGNVSTVVDAFLAAAVANTNTPWSSGSDSFSLTPIIPATTVMGSTATGLNVNTVYQVNVALDGGAGVELMIDLHIPQTPTDVSFNDLAEAMNLAMTASGMLSTASFVFGATGHIVVTSNTKGATSAVVLTDGAANGLVAALVAFAPALEVAAAGVNGTTNAAFPVVKAGKTWTSWNDVMQMWKSPTGFGALFTSGDSASVKKENKPAAKGNAVRTAVYWNGAAWKFFDNDVTVGAAVNPPEL